MSTIMSHPAPEIEGLRGKYYNSVFTKIILPHEYLMIIRVRPDGDVPEFLPGQFTALGLGTWEPCVNDARDDVRCVDVPHVLIKRLYSVSCSMLDERGQLLRANDSPYFEFYVSLVPPGDRRSLTLTPRLFALCEGARLFCSCKPHGHYTLEKLPPDGDVVFVGTGTGEAPHNAMVAELLARKHPGRIVSVTCARRKQDFAYRDKHRKLERRFANYRYLSLTTQEPENLDHMNPGFEGKRYLQDYFQSGDFERDAGMKLSPPRSHVFLCGNPMMIGLTGPKPDVPSKATQSIGMIQVLERLGFCLDHQRSPGNIHIEKYW